ncbi:MAG: hypothetical protein KC503_10560 [Myxococcales bacterium]|nr:hypothetical protein [Myxococcales bacterium]
MKKYLILYRAPISAQQQMQSATPEQAKAGMDAWMAWANRAASALVDLGAPLTSAGNVGGEAQSDIAGYSILQAESADAAKALLAEHPHKMMPGGSIEVLEYVPLPGM